MLQPPALVAFVCPCVRGRVWAPNPSIVVVDGERQKRLAAISNRRVSHKMTQLWTSWRVAGEKSTNYTLVREPRAPDLLQVISLSCP